MAASALQVYRGEGVGRGGLYSCHVMHGSSRMTGGRCLPQVFYLTIDLPSLSRRSGWGQGGKVGGCRKIQYGGRVGTYSFVACLSYFPINHASPSRRRAYGGGRMRYRVVATRPGGRLFSNGLSHPGTQRTEFEELRHRSRGAAAGVRPETMGSFVRKFNRTLPVLSVLRPVSTRKNLGVFCDSAQTMEFPAYVPSSVGRRDSRGGRSPAARLPGVCCPHVLRTAIPYMLL